MNDEAMKRFNDQWQSITDDIRADERARIIGLLQRTLDVLKTSSSDLVDFAEVPETPAKPAAPKRGRKAKADAVINMVEVEKDVLDALKRWSKPERPTAGDLAQSNEWPVSLVSKALGRLEKRGEVNHTGVKRGCRYFIPIAAARHTNSDHAEA